MRHRGIADLRADAGAVGLEEAAGELGAVVSDDVVGDAKTKYQSLDELDRGPRRDCADSFHLCPLGEFIDGDVEVAVAPERARERSQNVQPPDRERSGVVCSSCAGW